VKSRIRSPLSALCFALFGLALCLAACARQGADPVQLADARAKIGTTYPGLVSLFCPTPRIVGSDCHAVAGVTATVLDVVAASGGVFAKVRLADGREGYTPFGLVERAQLEHVNLIVRVNTEEQRMSKECNAVFDALHIGMSELDALALNQRPRIGSSPGFRCASVNTTETAQGTHDQFVFGDGKYAYFDRGVLTALQR
jgi:hypothetical protein